MKLNAFNEDLYQPILDSINNEPFVYVRNFGNYGDSLIREGSHHLFKKNNLDYISLDDSEEEVFKQIDNFKGDSKYKLFVFGGGGAWIEIYFKRMIRFIEKGLEIFDRVIVLPSTYQENELLKEFLSKIDRGRITFFRRDDFISKEAISNSILTPDMALCLENIEIENEEEKGREGNFFRVDIEAAGKVEVPENNFNLSGQGNDMDKVEYFFNYLNSYSILNTDRLHVCIAGYLLGKEVNFHNNSYDKNKSFYLTHFKDKENIKFID